jgi:hypothetical protein
MVQAYAWLQLYVDRTDSVLPSSARPELNNFALQVDVATSQAGKRLAGIYKSGQWPVLVIESPTPPTPPPVAAVRPRTLKEVRPLKPFGSLKVNFISQDPNPTAVIDGKVFKVGDTVTILAKPKSFVVTCLKIGKDSVTVSVDGEDDQRELRFEGGAGR